MMLLWDAKGMMISSIRGIASIKKGAAPEMLLALMDEAYTDPTIGDGGADSESEDGIPMAVDDRLILDLLKDENDGLAVWSFLCINKLDGSLLFLTILFC